MVNLFKLAFLIIFFTFINVCIKGQCIKENPSVINNKDDSIVNYELLSELRVVDSIRVLICDEIFLQRRNFQFIKALQENLNSRNYNFQLSIEENLILFIYTYEWDSVLNIIPKMDYPYKRDKFWLDDDDILFMRTISLDCPTMIKLKKNQFVNNQIYSSIFNANLPDEQKDFLWVFIPRYFSYRYWQGKVKIEDACKAFKKQYPKSQYLKYIE